MSFLKGKISILLSIIAYAIALIEFIVAIRDNLLIPPGSDASASLLVFVEVLFAIAAFVIGSFFTLYAKLVTKEKKMVYLSLILFLPNFIIILFGDIYISISTLVEQISTYTLESVFIDLLFAVYAFFIGKKHWNALSVVGNT